jgi:VanZ family protein
MQDKFLKAAAWAMIAFIIYATLVPLGLRPTMRGFSPDIERFAAYAIASTLLVLAYPRHPLRIALVITAIAVLLESLQLLLPDRDARAMDAVIKVIGGLVGASAAFGWIRWLTDQSQSQNKV